MQVLQVSTDEGLQVSPSNTDALPHAALFFLLLHIHHLLLRGVIRRWWCAPIVGRRWVTLISRRRVTLRRVTLRCGNKIGSCTEVESTEHRIRNMTACLGRLGRLVEGRLTDLDSLEALDSLEVLDSLRHEKFSPNLAYDAYISI